MLLKTLLLHNLTENPAFGQVTTQPLAFIGDQQIFSILGRFNYAWDNQLIMTATFRRDGCQNLRKTISMVFSHLLLCCQ